MRGNGRDYSRIKEGEIRGYLTVLWMVDGRHWECECCCGNRFDVLVSTLKKNPEKLHCGCKSVQPSKYIVMPGVFVERWEVLKRSDRIDSQGKRKWWQCRCRCGVEKDVRHSDLRTGVSLSCGCWRGELLRERELVHGLSKTTTYVSWLGMMRRCYLEGTERYKDYGGRGISVCARWRESFTSFLEDMGERPDKMTLDRKEVNGNYEPSNCRWATSKEQGRNRRNNRILTLNGDSKTAIEWSEQLGIPHGRIFLRLSRGWSDEEVLTTPLRKKRGDHHG